MKKLRILSLLAIAFLAVSGNAQVRKIDESAWMTVTEKSGFSVRLPKSSLVHVEESAQNPRTSLYGFADGVSISLARTKTSSAKRWIRTRSLSQIGKAVPSEQKIDDVELRIVITNDDSYRLTIVAASDSKYYTLAISGETRDEPAIGYVLRSIRINGKAVFESKGVADRNDGASVELGSLETSKEFEDALKAKRPKWN